MPVVRPPGGQLELAGQEGGGACSIVCLFVCLLVCLFIVRREAGLAGVGLQGKRWRKERQRKEKKGGSYILQNSIKLASISDLVFGQY